MPHFHLSGIPNKSVASEVKNKFTKNCMGEKIYINNAVLRRRIGHTIENQGPYNHENSQYVKKIKITFSQI